MKVSAGVHVTIITFTIFNFILEVTIFSWTVGWFMPKTGDLYRILGVAENCTNAEVKAAYLKLAKQWHPDVNRDPIATAKFRDISRAYDALKTESSRYSYMMSISTKYGYSDVYGGFKPRDANSTYDQTEGENDFNGIHNCHLVAVQ